MVKPIETMGLMFSQKPHVTIQSKCQEIIFLYFGGCLGGGLFLGSIGGSGGVKEVGSDLTK